jgi:hypothetical protein
MNNAIVLDHLTTWNEVCDSVGFTLIDALERLSAWDICCEVVPGVRGGVRVLTEDVAWQALANEAMEKQSN